MGLRFHILEQLVEPMAMVAALVGISPGASLSALLGAMGALGSMAATDRCASAGGPRAGGPRATAFNCCASARGPGAAAFGGRLELIQPSRAPDRWQCRRRDEHLPSLGPQHRHTALRDGDAGRR